MKVRITGIMFLLLMGLVSAACTDSDGGKNKYEWGSVTDNVNIYEDICDGENIKEYFCSVDDVASYTTLQCVNGCKDAACQLENKIPKAQAPEEESTTNTQIYLYAIAIVIIVGLYIYWFKLKPKKKKRFSE